MNRQALRKHAWSSLFRGAPQGPGRKIAKTTPCKVEGVSARSTRAALRAREENGPNLIPSRSRKGLAASMDIIKQSPRASIAHPRFLFKGEKTYTTATKASPSIRPTCAGRLTGQA